MFIASRQPEDNPDFRRVIGLNRDVLKTEESRVVSDTPVINASPTDQADWTSP